MIIDHIHIDGFGKLRDLDAELSGGINIIYGRNEAGKSTLHAFLMAMLFGLSRSHQRPGEEPAYERYRSWDDPDHYGGELRFTFEDRSYRLRRDFTRGPQDIHIFDAEGKELPDPEALLSSALLSMTEAAYRSTASIGQLKAAAGRDMQRELRQCIENLNTTGSLELSSDAAVALLEQERKKKEELYDAEAVKSYASVMGRIKNIETELSAPENENLLKQYQDLKDGVSSELAEQEEKLSEARARRDSAASVLSENGFADRHAIDALEDDLRRRHDSWLVKKKKAGSRLLPGGAAAAFLAAALLVANTVLTFGPAAGYVPYMSAGGALCLVIVASVLLFIRHRRRKDLEACASELALAIEKQLGTPDITDSTLDDLHERMEGFRRTYEAKVAATEEEKQISDKIIELSRKQFGYQEDISRQQDINRTVEEKLLLLNSLRNKAMELKLVIAENSRVKMDMDALSMAAENIAELSREVKGSIGAYINKAAGEILTKVTGGAYSRLDVSDSMDIHVNTRERSIPLSKLSMGTMDQVYLAVRLAALRLMEGDRPGSLPVLFDDSFTLYDDERLKAAMTFIATCYEGQLIIFTCQHREKAILNELSVGHSYIRL